MERLREKLRQSHGYIFAISRLVSRVASHQQTRVSSFETQGHGIDPLETRSPVVQPCDLRTQKPTVHLFYFILSPFLICGHTDLQLQGSSRLDPGILSVGG